LSTPTDDPNKEVLISKLNRTPEEYLKDRVERKMRRYVRKATHYRYAYWILASVAAIGSSVVPVLVNFKDVRPIYPTVVSLIVVAAVALESVFHPREHWRNYDLISSVMREEEMEFSTRTGPYAKLDSDKDKDAAFHKFVERIETAIAKERAETIVMRTTTESGKGSS
jgi:hypothetical protein